MRQRTEFCEDAESGGEDCDISDTDASEEESTHSHDDDLINRVQRASSPSSASGVCDDPYEWSMPVSMVTAPHDTPVPLLPLARFGAKVMSEPVLLRRSPQSATGGASSFQTPCSLSLAAAATPSAHESRSLLQGAATLIALDTISQPESRSIEVDPQSESESDDDSDDASGDDSDNDSECEIDSDEESDCLAEFEASFFARHLPGHTSPAVPLNCKKISEIAHPTITLSTGVASQCSLAADVGIRTLRAITDAPTGIGTNVGCFDATGKPNKKAANSCQNLRFMSTQDCSYLSDLNIAARLATTFDEDVAPFRRRHTTSRQSHALFPVDTDELCENAPCAGKNRDIDEIGESHHQAKNECQGMFTQVRLMSPSLNDKSYETDDDRILLVDWNASDNGLLVTWGDASDSEPDNCDEGLLASGGGDSRGDSGDHELEQRPIVSNWNPRQSNCDNGTAVKHHSSSDSSSALSDKEQEIAYCASRRPESSVNDSNHTNVLYANDISSIAVDFHDSGDASPVSTVSNVLPHFTIQGRSPKSTNRQQALGQQVSFRNAFKTLTLSDDDNLRRDIQRETNFPRIDFRLDRKKRTRRLKKGETDSQSTRRRRKVRENEIKFAMGVEKCYIEGLCMINQSQGKTIACKIKSQI